MRFPRADLARRLSPYPINFRLYTGRDAYCKAKRAQGQRGERADLEPDDIGEVSAAGQSVIIGVFNGSPATLVHEIVHAIEHIATHLNLPRGLQASEPKAYLAQHMFTICAPHLHPPT